MLCPWLQPAPARSRCRCGATPADGAPEVSRPAWRSNKPIRSKHLSPLSLDPEMVPQHPPAGDEWRSVGRKMEQRPLPIAYQQQQDSKETEASIHSPGFFFSDQRELLSKVQSSSKQQQQQHDLHGRTQLNTNYRYAVEEDGLVVDMINAKRSVPGTFQHAILHGPTDDTMPVSNLRLGGKYLERHASNSSAAQDILSERGAVQPRLCLKAFVYCVQQSELFTPLWELDMVDQIEWVPSLSQANVVLHRRPQPGEKQFHYDQFRSEASSLGIPFVSINAPTASELRKSLLPIMDLYQGKVALPRSGRGSKLLNSLLKTKPRKH